MKKLSLTSILIFSSSIALAGDLNFVASDTSPFTAICIAATQSEEAVSAQLHEHSLTRSDIRTLSCNGMSLNRFAAKYNSAPEVATVEPVRVFAFRESVSNSETSLCIAAATSNEEYARLKNELFSGNRSLVRSITCNDLPLQSFARRHGNSEFRI
mgnify:CR=1 FL=1